MIARTSATVAPRGVLRDVRCEPPLTLRQVRTDAVQTCALCLVGSAAGPLAGDDLTLDLDVLPQAHATISATGAQLAQGREGGQPSAVRTRLAVGDGASLTGDTGALVVAAGGAVHVDVDIAAAETATVEWRELIVLGRSGEPAGQATLRWNVTIGGRPLLRQTLDLAEDPSAMLLAGHRVVASMLIAGPGVDARTVVLHPSAVAARLGAHAALLTVLAADAAAAMADLVSLREMTRAGQECASRAASSADCRR